MRAAPPPHPSPYSGPTHRVTTTTMPRRAPVPDPDSTIYDDMTLLHLFRFMFFCGRIRGNCIYGQPSTYHHPPFSFLIYFKRGVTRKQPLVRSFCVQGGGLLGLRCLLSPVHAVRLSSARRAWWEEKGVWIGGSRRRMDTEKRKGVGEGNQGRREGQEPHVEWMGLFLEWKRATATARRGRGDAGDLAAFLLLFCRFLPHGAFPSFCRLHSTFFRYPHTRHTRHYICRCCC